MEFEEKKIQTTAAGVIKKEDGNIISAFKRAEDKYPTITIKKAP